jgi:hypothetical protein
MSNRRRSERFTVALPVTLKDGKGGESTRTSNISAHGIAVFSTNARPLRQYLELDIHLPENDVPITITAVVARHADKLDAGQGTNSPGLGLDFFLFDARAKQMWAQFLSELRRKGVPAAAPLIPPPAPEPLEPAFDDTPTFIIKPRDLGRLWAFYRGEMTKGRVRIETPIIKPIGTRVELLVVHPSSQAEWVLEGSIATSNQNARGGRPVLEIELDNLGNDPKSEFRNFVATGRGMIEEDVSMSLEVPSSVSSLPPPTPSIKPVDLDDEDVEMPPTVLAEASGPKAPDAEENEAAEFRFESVVIDLDNLSEEQLRSGIVSAPAPRADEEDETLEREPPPPPLRTFDDEPSDPTITPHSPEVIEDRELREALAPSNRSLFGAFFDEAAEAEEQRRSAPPIRPLKLETTARLRAPSGGKPRLQSVSPAPQIDDLTPPKTGLRSLPGNGEIRRAQAPELPSKRPPPVPLPSGDEPFAPLTPDEGDFPVVRGAPESFYSGRAPPPPSLDRSDEPIELVEEIEPVFGSMSPQIRGIHEIAQNPPVPPGNMFEAEDSSAELEPVPRAGSRKPPPPLPPSARRRAIKESAGGGLPQSMSTEGTDPELDRDIALARARMVRSPNSVTACYRLSTLLMRRGDQDNFADALTTLQRVMELEPNHPAAHHKLAEVLARRGEYREASEHLARARRLGYRVDPDLDALVANGVKQLEQG